MSKPSRWSLRARSFFSRLGWALRHSWVALGIWWDEKYFGRESRKSCCDDCPDGRPVRRSKYVVTRGVGGTICLSCSWLQVVGGRGCPLGEEYA